MPEQGVPPGYNFNSRLHTLLDDLADTLADSRRRGAGPRPGGRTAPVCVVVLDEEDQLIELVNPEIVTEGEQTGPGGLPERSQEIWRGNAA